ncbi:hypothetical protein Ancab_024070 [Ancistrocladus abbreviatus]
MESPSFYDVLKKGSAAKSPTASAEPSVELVIPIYGGIPSTSHLPAVSPMLPDDLGVGMALTSTPCVPVSSTPVVMTGITIPEGMGLEFYQGLNHNTLSPIDSLQDEHSITQILDIDKKEAKGQMLLD